MHCWAVSVVVKIYWFISPFLVTGLSCLYIIRGWWRNRQRLAKDFLFLMLTEGYDFSSNISETHVQVEDGTDFIIQNLKNISISFSCLMKWALSKVVMRLM